MDPKMSVAKIKETFEKMGVGKKKEKEKSSVLLSRTSQRDRIIINHHPPITTCGVPNQWSRLPGVENNKALLKVKVVFL